MEQVGREQCGATTAKIGIGERDIEVVHVVVPSHGVTDDAIDRPASQSQRPRQRPAQTGDVGEVALSHIIPPISTEASQVAEFMSGMGDIYTGSIRVAHDTLRLPVTRRRD